MSENYARISKDNESGMWTAMLITPHSCYARITRTRFGAMWYAMRWNGYEN